MVLELTSGAMATLIAEARGAHPRECCGLLLGHQRITVVMPTANVAADPETRFEIDPAALIAAHRAARAGGLAVLGYYHSHPGGRPEPSAQDRAAASGDGRVWLIVAGEMVRAWRDTPKGFVALGLRHIDG